MSPARTAVVVAAQVFFPVLGNLRPGPVSFLPSMRQYAGNRASAPWTFTPAADPNFVGGNILTGAEVLRQRLFGPRTTLQPYDTGAPGHYLCSAATPPGPGAHGMCGARAAARALDHLRR